MASEIPLYDFAAFLVGDKGKVPPEQSATKHASTHAGTGTDRSELPTVKSKIRKTDREDDLQVKM
jgi:hypothetical protein